jgi:hypothetical protein
MTSRAIRTTAALACACVSSLTIGSSLGAQSTPTQGPSPVTTSTPQHPEAVLSNDQLRVRVYLPHPERGFYRSTRFDWSGVISSLTYKGHEFYGRWFTAMDPPVRDFIYKGADIITGAQSSITGPAEEFQRPQGYTTAKPGETFVKVGVGVLRKKDDTPYSAYNNYDVASTGQWTVEEGPGWLEMIQTVNDSASGYGYEYRKTMRLTKGQPVLVIEHALRNTGRLPIETPQYSHNFLVLDGAATGPDFLITVPFQIKTAKPPDPALAEIRGNQIAYTKVLTGEDRVTFPVDGFSTAAKDYDIRVENRATGAGFRVTSDRPLARLPLWSIRSVVSMEPFVDVTTAPGQTTTWKYTYTYFAK